VTLMGTHPTSAILIGGYLLGLRLVHNARDGSAWRALRTEETVFDEVSSEAESSASTRVLAARLVVLGLLVAAEGWAVAKAGATIAEQTGLTATATGALLTATATSLPELVTTLAAVRRGALTLAVGGIVGGNTFNVLFVAFADVAYRPGSLYHAVGSDQLLVLVMALIMTAVVILGLLARQRRGVANIGGEGVLITFSRSHSSPSTECVKKGGASPARHSARHRSAAKEASFDVHAGLDSSRRRTLRALTSTLTRELGAAPPHGGGLAELAPSVKAGNTMSRGGDDAGATHALEPLRRTRRQPAPRPGGARRAARASSPTHLRRARRSPGNGCPMRQPVRKFEWPPDKDAAFRHAIKLEWLTIAYLVTATALLFAVLGGSQAMRAGLFEKGLSVTPPIAFLVSGHFRDRPPNERFPWGYHRAVSLAYLASAAALLVLD
jgi:hypothetical protein